MSDGEVQEIQEPEHSEETKGKLIAFRQILEDIDGKQKAMPDRISAIKGEARAYATMAELIQGRITQRIHKLSAKAVDREIIKDEQEFTLSLRALCNKAHQESINEKIRLEGEARSLLMQVQVISNLHKKALANELTLRALEVQQDSFREQQVIQEVAETNIESPVELPTEEAEEIPAENVLNEESKSEKKRKKAQSRKK